MTVSTQSIEDTEGPLEPGRPDSGGDVAPSLDDPVANLGSEGFGGVLGRRARTRLGPVGRASIAFILLVLTVLTTAVGIGMREPCFATAWTGGGNQQYTHMCYSDIPYMYQGRGFSSGDVPYYSTNTSYYLEYPVVTGAAMESAALIAKHFPGGANNQGRWFYVITTWFLLIFACITVIALVGLSGSRPWDAAMFALAPGLLLNATINWDLIAVGLAAAGLLAWARKRPVVAGVLIGLGTAAKLYPALILVALILLCWRAGRMRSWGLCLLGAAGSWLLVNVPFMVANFHGWAYFYSFNENRGADWGSFWLFLEYSPFANTLHLTNLSSSFVSAAFAVLLAMSCVGIGLLTWLARFRPRVGQIVFLVACAFILFNKVYSPQYVLWLIPLAVLARPRWRDFIVWQVCEVVYYGAIWLYLVSLNTPLRGLPQPAYDLAIALHLAGTIFFAVQVIRDVIDPRRDPVRMSGMDDPAGGVLDGAEDVYGFGLADEDAYGDDADPARAGLAPVTP
ncbi:MAG TPA: glycosyltransferase 87 family protein [Actinospica sp.]|nr:glycosyltransferase 87 family protein [Actinospica sp.]